jgi:DNA-binding NtrC family response regulator
MTATFSIDHIIGESPQTLGIRQRIQQVAAFRYSVLITGPSGTGKELVARAIHVHSDRAEKPFIPVNCAALPDGLFASQLFGHVKGAFTGAQFNSLGCFRAAEGGTIFLDEIGELDLELQAKLLRVLQERVVVPVGSHDAVPVDVRVIAATNRNLEDEVRAGRFRLDLYYRLNVISVETAALADRPEDIAVLCRHFLAKAAIETGCRLKSLSPAALQLLQAYAFPGNVRELQNLIERAVVFCDGDVVGPECFPTVVEAVSQQVSQRGRQSGMAVMVPSRGGVAATITPIEPQSQSTEAEIDGDWMTLADIEAEHIRRTLVLTFYNQSAAARMLGIDRKLLARKIRKYGLRTSALPSGSRGKVRMSAE